MFDTLSFSIGCKQHTVRSPHIFLLRADEVCRSTNVIFYEKSDIELRICIKLRYIKLSKLKILCNSLIEK